MNDEKKWLGVYASLVIALIPILGCYWIIHGVSLDQPFILLFSLFAFTNLSWETQKDELHLFCAIMVIGFVSFLQNTNTTWFQSSLYINNLWTIGIYFFVVIVISPHVYIKSFIRIISILGLFVSYLSISQRFEIISTGGLNHIHLFPQLEQVEELRIEYLRRPTTLFLEPAHTSIFLLPIFELFLKFKNYLMAIIVAVGIFFTGSTTGFLVIIGLIILFLWENGRSIKSFSIVLVVSILALYITTIIAPDVIYSNVEKASSFENVSFLLRTIGGFVYFNEMPFYLQIFGLGLNQMRNFKASITGDSLNYANAIAFTLISYGYVGFIFLLKYIYNKTKICKGDLSFLLIFVAVLCTDQIIFNRHFAYLLTFVVLTTKIREQIDDENANITGIKHILKPIF